MFTANGAGLAGPDAGGVARRGRVTFCRPDNYLAAILKRRDNIHDFGVSRHANDNRMGIREQLRVLGVFVHRVGKALVAVAFAKAHGDR
ncbi:hypothetical protein FF100_04695 [Methylobacterium terricola]|uniref:Uncharacterized protein n=1 Tax=Methylobacterium terricola TaxID=2583531 RepID=A0A5C4LMS8_9HYPH|nr:hypothetical protein [Methylobacterium terricola]TNC14880.1 hypothetical protein FF100_04695 [Methylobacterium terricola]